MCSFWKLLKNKKKTVNAKCVSYNSKTYVFICPIERKRHKLLHLLSSTSVSTLFGRVYTRLTKYFHHDHIYVLANHFYGLCEDGWTSFCISPWWNCLVIEIHIQIYNTAVLVVVLKTGIRLFPWTSTYHPIQVVKLKLKKGPWCATKKNRKHQNETK